MRKVILWFGVLLALGAAGLFVQRWVVEPAKHGRYQQQSRGISEQRPAGRNGGGGPRDSTRRNSGPSSLQLFEIVIDLLNVVVGIVGIWLAVLGMRLRRASDPTRVGSRTPNA